jgi:AAA+ ATPase superfamily predicted ATPase
VERPETLFDREREWADLVGLVTGQQPRLRLGMVYGRRRFGKSFLLRRLVERAGGLYHLALEQEAHPALERFAAAVAGLMPVPAPLRLDDWDTGLSYALDHLGHSGAGPQVIVLDEYPYLRRASPELDSVLQALVDRAAAGDLGAHWSNPVTIVICGSALSVMTELLSGTSPLRGRATLDMPLQTFDFRQAREFWGIRRPATAFIMHAIAGGAPGYRDLTGGIDVPERENDLLPWLAATVLNPSHALFREDEYLLREDPRVTKQSLYYSLLGAIAAGATAPKEIAGRMGRKSTDIVHHLDVLVTAGFVTRDADVLSRRSPTYRVADPIVRFHELVTRRHLGLLEDRRVSEAWALADDTYRSQIVGPHFEELCRAWTARYASSETLGDRIGEVGSVQVNAAKRRQRFELDVVATTYATQSRRAKTIQVIGEAKGAVKPRTLSDLERLDRCVELLVARPDVSVATSARRLVFSLAGFDDELRRAAARRDDVELVDIERLYDGD